MKDCTERNRAGLPSTSAAALRLPRCIQMKTSVSKITMATAAQPIHDCRDRLAVCGEHAEEGVFAGLAPPPLTGGEDDTSEFAVIEDLHLLPAGKCPENLGHPVAQVNDGSFHDLALSLIYVFNM